ncbi:hypothetical protein G6F68_016956 [Rhizopus microsporus]|nr:hypothetical protein G6F68_016956 [Rhizopus microsporus]
MQFFQLLLVHFRRCIGQQILRALRLREGDHVADRFGAGHHRDDAVQAEGDAAVRRRAVLQRIQQVAELLAGFLGADLQRARAAQSLGGQNAAGGGQRGVFAQQQRLSALVVAGDAFDRQVAARCPHPG